MLKLRLQDVSKGNYMKVEFDDVKISSDFTYINFICDAKYDIQEQDTLFFNFNNEDKKPLKCSITNFTSYGYAFIPTTYNVQTLDNEKVKYIRFSDNQYYFNRYNLDSSGDMSSDNKIYINGETYDITNDNKVIVNERYHITGETLFTSDGKEYFVNIVKSFEEETEMIRYDISLYPSDESIVLDLFDKPIKLISVKVYDLINRNLEVSSAYAFEYKSVIIYQGKEYEVFSLYDNEGDEYQEVYINDKISGSSIFSDDSGEYNIISQIVLNDTDNTKCYVEYRMVENENGNMLAINMDNQDINLGDVIIAESINNDTRYETLLIDKSDETKSVLIFNGNTHYENKTIYKNGFKQHYDFLKIGDEEYEITYYNEDETSGYVVYNDEVINFEFNTFSPSELESVYGSIDAYIIDDTNLNYKTFSGENYTHVIGYFDETYSNQEKRVFTDVIDGKFFVAYRPISSISLQKTDSDAKILNQPFYGITRYTNVIINNTILKVYTANTFVDEETRIFTGDKYVLNPLKERYELTIDGIEGGKTFIVRPLYNKYSQDYSDTINGTDTIPSNIGGYNIDVQISNTIANNINSFVFFKKNSAFKEVLLNDFISYGNDTLYSNKTFNIYKDIDAYNVSLNINTEVANNIMQQDILETYFFGTEMDNVVNRIVDMERDLYYPVVRINDKYENIDKIVFNLHFRTRDLTTWDINEDEYQNLNVDTVLSGSSGCNWFCIDYYQPTAFSASCKHSDLVGFLGFNDDDVFYQKSKVGKSFLRLMFYDTNDPTKQSLLYSSTIWLDENNLYKKFIDNVEYNSIVSGEVTNSYYDIVNGEYIGEHINVNSEPCNLSASTNNEFNFIEGYRLDCQLSINNRYETTNSAEGFYLHIFKEMSSHLHERDIYMKVQFNHAGVGKTLTFMLPTNENGELITNFTSDNVKELCKGTTIGNIYDRIFIKVKIKYDIESSKYVWYLPTDLVDNTYGDNVMSFNLFELKLKDES